MKKINKKYLIKLVLVFIITFSIFSLFLKTTSAATVLTKTNLKSTSVTLVATGLTPGSSADLRVNAFIAKTTAYSNSISKVSDTNGKITASFTGLVSGGEYGASLFQNGKTLNTISFKTPTTGTITNTTTTKYFYWVQKTVDSEKNEYSFDSKEKCEADRTNGELTWIRSATCYTTSIKTVTATEPAIKYWWYTNIEKRVVGVAGLYKVYGGIGFEEKACVTARNNYIKNITSSGMNSSDIAECFQETVAGVEKRNQDDINNSSNFTPKGGFINVTPINVTPKTNVAENKSIYTLLAPIGKITHMNSTGCAVGDETCIPNDIGTYLNIIFKLGIGICAALAVIMLIINGVKYMGDESVFGKTEAKKQMFGAIVGLLIVLGAWALLNTINPALTGQKGLNISGANIEIQPNSIFSKPASDSVRCTPVLSGPCAVSNLSSTFNTQAEAMSKICNIESGGNAKAPVDLSKATDKGSDGTVFSFGLFQINLLANGSIIKDASGKSCEGLFVHTDGSAISGGDYIMKDASGHYKYNAKLKPGMESLYKGCKSVLLDSTQNIKYAKMLANSTLSAWRKSDIAVCASAFQ